MSKTPEQIRYEYRRQRAGQRTPSLRQLEVALADANPDGFDRHWNWYMKDRELVARREKQARLDPIPLGYPVLVQQYIDTAPLAKASGTNFLFGFKGAAGDGHLAGAGLEWDGVVDGNDITLLDDGSPCTIDTVDIQEDSTKVRVVSAPVKDSAMRVKYYISYDDLAAVQAIDNGKVINVHPLYAPNWTFFTYAVLVFAVPTIKTNTEIKGYIRMAANKTCDDAFWQYVYDFNTQTWTEAQADPDLTFTPDASGTTFDFHKFTISDNKFISSDNLMAIRWYGKKTADQVPAGFIIDYAWAWLDRKSGWF